MFEQESNHNLGLSMSKQESNSNLESFLDEKLKLNIQNDDRKMCLEYFLDSILKLIIQNDDDRKMFLDEKSLDIWKTVFYNIFPPPDNYQKLVFIGGICFRTIFTKYLMKQFPEFDRNEYTKIFSAYISVPNKIKVSRNFGFSNFIQPVYHDQNDMESSILEAFIGALDTISDNISFKLNYHNFIHHITQNIQIKNEYLEPKTELHQIFTRFNLSAPIESFSKYQNTILVTLKPEHLTFLHRHGIDIENPMIGVASSLYKKGASSKAYKQALITLRKYGVDSEWAKNTKEREIFEDKSLSGYIPKAYIRLKNEGYCNMKFNIVFKYINHSIVQLIGIDNNKQETVINYVYNHSKNYYQIKSLLIKNYVLTYKF